ncbi:MAG: HAMP domain-containing histidine kinase [Ignavibacteria bacterium]|nr:HAMP domain-containing histidine kinase [Ignavibacteria bacterium]
MTKINLFIKDTVLGELIQEILVSESYMFSIIEYENAFRLAQLTEFDLLIIDSEMIAKSDVQIIFLLKNSAAKRILLVNRVTETNSNLKFERQIEVNDVPSQLISSIDLISKISEVVKSGVENENFLKIQSQLFHEINNRLSSILINSKLLSQKDEMQNDSNKEHLQHILTSAKEIQENINNFSNFINCKKFFTSREDLNQLLSETLREKEESIKSKFVEVKTKYDVEIDFIELNRTIVSKLLLNTIDFVGLMSKENPTIKIETKNEPEQVVLEISSPNCGNDKSLFEQIFNPLFPRKMMDEKILKEMNKNIKQLMNFSIENNYSNDTISVIFTFKK